MKKRQPPKPDPASVFPDDISGAAGADAAGLLTLLRWFVAAVQLGDDAHPEAVIALSPHYASAEAAQECLPLCREFWPNAGVVSCILAFDPGSALDMERYERMRAETGAPPRKALQ